MEHNSIREINAEKVPLGSCAVAGWIRTHRQSKNVSFIEISDGTALRGLQLVVDPGTPGYLELSPKLTTGASIFVKGELVASPAKGQKFELRVSELKLFGEADATTYPLQKKDHTLEFLRENLHLRARTNTFGAVFRLRSIVSFAIHEFYQKRDFVYLHSPIISTSDCEGAGEMFRVTTLNPSDPPMLNGQVDFTQDFFKEEAGLTVSGQLEGETFALGLTKIYTFGPTFRAENSNTARHLAEFWMIEPEVAFNELPENMKLAEDFIKYMSRAVLEKCSDELEFFEKREEGEKELRKTLEQVVNSSFEVIDYTEAIKILERSGEAFEYPVKWGIDLQSEHERYLTDKHVKGPAFVINYPKEIKAFYMKQNDDGKTVRAMDLLVPRLGEIIGGSQREDQFDLLKKRMEESHLPVDKYWWYLDLRKFGTVPHAGFGLGLERFIMYVTGMHNIRDVIPFPRHPGFAKF